MKKGLLLLGAAAVAMSATAQKAAVAAQSKASASEVAPFVVSVAKAEMATDAQRKAAKKAASSSATKAWYNRPAGSFYRSLTSTGGAFYNPLLVSPCWRDVTFPNASTGATSYKWEYDKYDTSSKGWVTLNSTDENLTDNFIRSSMYAPTLTATGAESSSTYQLFADYTDDKKETTSYQGMMGYYDDPRASFLSGTNPVDCYLSPKLFAAGAREKVDNFKDKGGTITLTGATAAEGSDEGYWFGKNGAGWNALGLYVEQPASPYALRGIHVYYGASGITGATPLVAKVYEASKDAEGKLVIGNLICTAKGTLAADAATRGFIDMPIKEVEDGMEYEVIEEINEPIVIVLSGYEKAAAKTFYTVISTDCVDEGYGQHGYMIHVDDEGYPTKVYGMDEFFTVSLGYTAPSIFLDVEWPIMMWNYTFEDGKYNFPVAGGAWSKTVGTSKFDYISVYSTKSSEEWNVSLEDGEDVPEWLHLDIADVKEDGEFSGEVQIKATADALPSGTNYRVAKVEFSVPGASAVYEFSQGTPSGINDVVATGNVKAQKVVENGQVLIKVGDKKYNVMGAEVK